ncbi:50S ribosomal protein L23 [Candidatus Berkiella cookevillensis]|jgi:large subunit ribosomal protein L23|uniref:Large ribosomal subunit protein uL23 n=1 Tax=Candidatus Berkiella cookevillensis TaxID=437022 RepID=A0A0Q9YND9_9GAMM|nr:50S ribosomal protein L23 [Candidatus Berkiella cookevillensis]MCS5709392.1 50S ribosomal protein L23 [Candidatus Berkiella cookevillensis]
MICSEDNLINVLVAPITSEKTTRSGEAENSVAFWVNPKATKDQIKKAVETFFKGVQVKSVRTLIKRRDFVKFGETRGRRKASKKAYITLKPGHEINFAEMASQ